ncbi:MAG TPA: site-specific integrase [Nitrososphaeraceae archaeon]
MQTGNKSEDSIVNNDLAASKNYIKKIESDSNSVHKYIENVRIMNQSTASQYQIRLKTFVSFAEQEFDYTIDILLEDLKKYKIDVYDVLARYASFLVSRETFSSLSIKNWVDTTKNFLEFFDIDISPKKFKMKVRLPKVVRKSKDALTKELIVEILNACSDIRLKTYVMLLATTGMRPTEALSTRICDLNVDVDGTSTIFIRGEYTKTRTDRRVFLTKEAAKQIELWIEFKYRTRRTSYYHKTTGNSVSEYRTPQRNSNDLLFSTQSSTTKANTAYLQSLYVVLRGAFAKMLDRMNMGQREDSPGVKRRRITLHSFRRWVKSTISDLGHADYSEYFIGHAGSTYYRKSDKEKAEIFKKIEPYLTFLDITTLERKGADTQTRIEELQFTNQMLRQKDSMNAEAIASLSDQLMKVIQEIETLKSKR